MNRPALAFIFVAALLPGLSRRGVAALAGVEPTSKPAHSGVVIQSDLSPAATHEVALRLRVLRPVLRDPRWGFPPAATIGDFNVRLFRSPADFIAAGGPRGTAGVFLPDGPISPGCAPGHILAVTGPLLTLQTWHVLQHEAFHQFAFAALAGRTLPPWLDEGLAEYVGEALFTGDGYVIGIIPPWRLARLQGEIRAQNLPPLTQLLSESRPQWSARLTVARYDQVWSLAHFLCNAENGRFMPLLADCVRTGDAAHLPDRLESRWRAFWLSQPPNPTADLYIQCVRETFNSFLGRATAAGQRFDSFAEFRAVVEHGKLQLPVDQWLPPSLLQDALNAADANGTWTLVHAHSADPHLELHVR